MGWALLRRPSAPKIRRRRYRRISREAQVQTSPQECRRGGRRENIVVGCSAVLVFCAITGVVTWHLALYHGSHVEPFEPPDPTWKLPPSPSFQHIYRRAAVCSDGTPCSRIGRDMLARNGSAVDAAIAALFCNGVVNMQSMGLGGGFIMTIYQRQTKTAHSLIARETAPAAATKDMFTKNNSQAREGPLAAGVPGELRGYWEAHQRFGRLPWEDLVSPSLQLCRDGYHMSKHQHDALSIHEHLIRSDPNLKKWFVNPNTSEFYPTGSLTRAERLCDTLEVIAKEGGDALHNGSLTKIFVEDIKAMGGIITEEDMRNYKAEWTKPVSIKLHNNTLHTSPLPGSGALLAFILNVLDGYNMNEESIQGLDNETLTIHRMVEAFKYAYAKRTSMGDPAFENMTQLMADMLSEEYADEVRLKIKDDKTFNNPKHYGAMFYNQEDHGTAHISILDENGDAVSVTSTVNLYFGGGVTSERTGIILNSGMDDFSLPGVINHYGISPSSTNFIAPGKRSMSSVSPTVIVDQDGDVVMVVGASGGPKITTAVTYAIMRFLWMENSIKEAVDESRIHHQLSPMEISYEYGVTESVLEKLRALGHHAVRYRDRGSIICALGRKDKKIYANADYRKGGEVYGLG